MDKESEVLKELEKESDIIKKKFDDRLYEEGAADTRSAKLRLEYILDKIKKHKTTGLFVIEKYYTLNFVMEELTRRNKEKCETLKAKYEWLLAENKRLEALAANNM